MSKKSRGRTTGPKYRAIKTTADLTDWLNRAFSRGGRGTSHTAQKARKRDFLDLSTKRYYRRKRVHRY